MGTKSKRRTARLVEQFVRRTASRREQKWLGERVTRPSSSALRIDREQQILYGVKILGPESLNRRRYTPEAIASGRTRYENAKVYTDHPERKGQARKVEELLGWLINVREEQGCLYADLKYLKSHPAHAMLLEVAERNPSVLGFSHNARGDVETLEDGTEVIHQILEVISVDLVTDPATTNGLFEGRDVATEPKLTKLKAWWQAVRLTEGRRRILTKHVAEMGDMYDDVDVPGEAPATTAADSDHEAALMAGFRAAAMAVFDDDSLDAKGKLQKWKEILAAQEKLLGGKPEEPVEEEDDEDEDGKKDGKKDDKTEARIRRLERREKAYELLEAAGLPPTDRVLVEALIGLGDEASMKRLIEREKARGATPPTPKPAPRSGTTGGGNGGASGNTTDDIGDWMASLRG